jgi:hypothetical protein
LAVLVITVPDTVCGLVVTENVTATELLPGTPGPIVHVMTPVEASTLTEHVGVVLDDRDPHDGEPAFSVVPGGAESVMVSTPLDAVPAGLV